MVSREVGRACAPCASLKSLFRIKCWGAGENRPGRRRVGFTPASSRPIGRVPAGGGHWREGPKVEYSPREATRADPRELGVGLRLSYPAIGESRTPCLGRARSTRDDDPGPRGTFGARASSATIGPRGGSRVGSRGRRKWVIRFQSPLCVQGARSSRTRNLTETFWSVERKRKFSGFVSR